MISCLFTIFFKTQTYSRKFLLICFMPSIVPEVQGSRQVALQILLKCSQTIPNPLQQRDIMYSQNYSHIFCYMYNEHQQSQCYIYDTQTVMLYQAELLSLKKWIYLPIVEHLGVLGLCIFFLCSVFYYLCHGLFKPDGFCSQTAWCLEDKKLE